MLEGCIGSLTLRSTSGRSSSAQDFPPHLRGISCTLPQDILQLDPPQLALEGTRRLRFPPVALRR